MWSEFLSGGIFACGAAMGYNGRLVRGAGRQE